MMSLETAAAKEWVLKEVEKEGINRKYVNVVEVGSFMRANIVKKDRTEFKVYDKSLMGVIYES